MARKNKRVPTDASTEPLGSLGEIFSKSGFKPSESTESESDAPSQQSNDAVTISKGVRVRKERKGRAGKTVTMVENTELNPSDLKRLLKEMRKSLGCGAHIEAGTIVLQGDLTTRAAEWLDQYRDVDVRQR